MMTRSPLFGFTLLTGLFVLASNPILAADARAEPVLGARENARWFARLDQTIVDRDHCGYCAVLVDGPDFKGYLQRACKSGTKKTDNNPSACTDAAMREQVTLERKQ